MNQEFVQRFMDQFSQLVEEMPAGWERWLDQRAGPTSPAWFLLGLLSSSVIYAAFGALGGLIGASIFGRKISPPPGGPPHETSQNPSHRQP
jgi:antibiotic biosynthesis monooxygenase (ABM) superfamily enzyme